MSDEKMPSEFVLELRRVFNRNAIPRTIRDSFLALIGLVEGTLLNQPVRSESAEEGFHNWAVWKTRAEAAEKEVKQQQWNLDEARQGWDKAVIRAEEAEKKVEALERIIDRYSLGAPIVRTSGFAVQMRKPWGNLMLEIVEQGPTMGQGVMITVADPQVNASLKDTREAKEEGYKEGYAKGFSEGHMKGWDTAADQYRAAALLRMPL